MEFRDGVAGAALHVGQEAALRLVEAFCMTESNAVLSHGARELDVLRDVVVSGWLTPRHSDADSFLVEGDAVRKKLEEDSAASDTSVTRQGADAATTSNRPAPSTSVSQGVAGSCWDDGDFVET